MGNWGFVINMTKIFRLINHLFWGTGLVLLFTQTAGAQNVQADTVRQAVAQRLSFITIGAKDLPKLRQFYVEKFNWVPLPFLSRLFLDGKGQ